MEGDVSKANALEGWKKGEMCTQRWGKGVGSGKGKTDENGWDVRGERISPSKGQNGRDLREIIGIGGGEGERRKEEKRLR